MATATITADAPAPKGKKKLFIIIAVVAVVLLVGAGSALLLLKKSTQDLDEADADGQAATQTAARSSSSSRATPIYVPLDAFTVNLADRDAERYAQIGMTLQIQDAKMADQIKLYMPAIRNNILLVIAERTAGDLMGREGKSALADQVMRETSRALGYEVGDDAGADSAATGRKQRRAAPALPIKAVHFSNFIIQ